MKKIVLILSFVCTLFGSMQAQKYYVYVTAESNDEVALVSYDVSTNKAVTEKRIVVGYMPSEIEGPHGITVVPDGQYWYLSMAHGNPNGYLYKFKTGSDEMIGKTTLGLFLASMQISEATGYLFCVNFNLHGAMVPSTISVVDPVSMTEIMQVPVGTMPHGSRLSPDGMKQYSVGMMSGDLFEINTVSFQVSRILDLDNNKAIDPKMYGKMSVPVKSAHAMAGMDHSAHMNHDGGEMKMKHSAIKPTWVQPHPTKDLIYVAGNGSDEVLEIDAKNWTIINRMKAGKAPYNLDITPDGNKLIVSYKGG